MMKKPGPSTGAKPVAPGQRPIPSNIKQPQSMSNSTTNAQGGAQTGLIHKLHEEIKKLTEENIQYKAELDKSNRMNESIIAELNEKNSAKDIEIMSLNSELSTAQQRCDALTAQSSGLKLRAEEKAAAASKETLQENQSLQDQVTKFKNEISLLQQNLASQADKIDFLQDQNQDLTQIIAELEERKNNLEAELALETDKPVQQPQTLENLALDDTSPEVIEVNETATIQIEKFNETQKTINQISDLKIDKNLFKKAVQESKELISKQIEIIESLRVKNQQQKRQFGDQVSQLSTQIAGEMQSKEALEEVKQALENTVVQLEGEVQDLLYQLQLKTQNSTTSLIQQATSVNNESMLNVNKPRPEEIYHSLVVPSAKSLEKVQYSEMKRRISALQTEVKELSGLKNDIKRLQNDNNLLRKQLGEKSAQLLQEQQNTTLNNKSFTKISMLGAEDIPSNLQLAMQRVQNTTPSFMTNLIKNKTILEEPSLLEQAKEDTVVSYQDIQDLLGDDVNDLKNALLEAKNEYDALHLVLAQRQDEIIDLKEKNEELQNKNQKLNRKLKKTVGENTNIDVQQQVGEVKEELRKRRLVEIDVQDFQVQVGLIGMHGQSMLLQEDKQTQYQDNHVYERNKYTLVSDDHLQYDMSKDGWFEIKSKNGVSKYKIQGDNIVNQLGKTINFDGYLKTGEFIYQVDSGNIIKEQSTPYIEADSKEGLAHRITFPALQTQVDLYKKEVARLELDTLSLRKQVQLLQDSLLSDKSKDILHDLEETPITNAKQVQIEQVCQTDINFDEFENTFNKSLKTGQLQQQLEQYQLELNQNKNQQQIEYQQSQQQFQQQGQQPQYQLQQQLPQQFGSNQPIIVYPPFYPQSPYQTQNYPQQYPQQQIQQQPNFNQQQFPQYNNDSHYQQQIYSQQQKQQNYQSNQNINIAQRPISIPSATSPTPPSCHIYPEENQKFTQTELLLVEYTQYEQLKLKLNYLTSENAKMTLQTQKSGSLRQEFTNKQQELQNCVKYIKTLNERIRGLEEENQQLQEQISQLTQLPLQQSDITLDINDVFKLQHKATQNSFIGLQNRLIQKDNDIQNLNILLDQQRKQNLETVELLNIQIMKVQQAKSVVEQNKLDEFNRELFSLENDGISVIKNGLKNEIQSNIQEYKQIQNIEVSQLEINLRKTQKAAKIIKSEYVKISGQLECEKRRNIQMKESLGIVFMSMKWADLSMILDAGLIDQLRNEVQKRFLKI
ncbi:hypothetical protein SS50377_27420 [Spironucleus salmonicida]|uniref:Uncharacterized protein n=1 Tax=Spironucleus salmonicida TaxID=348837 RepID=V6LR85_9EUKA|nr:hypothetical protein SS50377_27420 [Spironucleus salmonicida]|eukprot:EST43289.1 Hypothetical protein SS50377_16954 [Spironucleus salmonicida]